MVADDLGMVYGGLAVLVPLAHELVSPLLFGHFQGRHGINPEDIILAHLSDGTMFFEELSRLLVGQLSRVLECTDLELFTPGGQAKF